MKTKSRFMAISVTPRRTGRARGSISLALAILGFTAAQVLALQNESNAEKPVVRTLEMLDLGYRLPIDIVRVKNLQSKHWMRDLEIEVRNISAKPIYLIYVALWLPNDNYLGLPFGGYIRYGAMRFVNPRQRPSPEDVPIAPGETITLKVDEELWTSYEHHTRRPDVPDQAGYRVRLVMEEIQFGDGTGFIHGGVPYSGNEKAASRYQRYVIVPVSPE